MKELESKEIKQLPGSTSQINGIQELYQKRWFCVALLPSGKAYKQDADSPLVFLEVINRALVTWVDLITDEPMKDLAISAAQMGFSEPFVASISGESTLNYQDFDTELWMRLPCIQIRGIDVKAYPLFMLVRKKLVFTIHTSLVDKRFIRLRRYSDTIIRKIPLDASIEDKQTLLIMRIIDTNNDSNFRHLRIIEEKGDDLNEALMSTQTDRATLGPRIYELKHALITYMNGLWESVDVLHTLRYGDAELITNEEKMLDMISVMIDEVKSQIGLAEHMSEVLASGLEVMQSIYNNQLQALNNRLALVMTYLTIVGTAVLVPNTLATILGNAVFDISPADLWWYIILMVGATAISTALVWWWLKKRGWLPRNPEGK
ncbi:MAG: CorA family divalent cation transporter [Dehalococcoidales bacterium]|nr:CorA family divalent cation transporter [Dehalococcoidales bacterium]